MGALLRRRPLLALLAAGLAVRLVTILVYDHAVFSYYGGDSTRYLRLYTDAGLFSDRYMPAGYPAFLRGLRALWPSLPFVIALQHLIGLGTASVLFAALRRFGAAPAVALVPAAVVALGGDQIFLEHALLTETLWGFAIALGLYALARAHERRDARWLAGAGVLLALSALVRNSALVLPPLAGAWAAVCLGGRRRVRARSLAAVLVPAIVVVAGYAALAHAVGEHDGLAESTGFLRYLRVAPFADCRRFRPPAGTERLCDSTPPSARPGPLAYGFDATAPRLARYTAASTPSFSALGSFALRAIEHQPLDYLRAAAKDELRYLAPRAGSDRPGFGAGPDEMSFDHTEPVVQPGPREDVARNYRLVYSGVGRPKRPGAGFAILAGYQEVFRLGGLLLAAVWALIAAGLVAGRGPLRAPLSLLAAFAFVLYAAPPIIFNYDVRYGVTPAPLAAGAAALAVVALLERKRRRPE